MRIGVDVGGTNTDAVLLHGRQVMAAVKSPTTPDVKTGIVVAIRELLVQSGLPTARIQAVSIGTTQFTNAFVQGKGLNEVAAVRLGLPATTGLVPFVDWPPLLAKAVGALWYMAKGGHEYDGRTISPLDHGELREIAAEIRRKGLRTIAITSVFSPIDSAIERAAAALFREEIPGVRVTLSSEIGRIGLIERENATIMNASLADLARQVVTSFREALRSLDIAAPCFISQNDGTLLSAERVERHPVLTFASGPTNSMRGAAFLTGLDEALVVDIGGTTTDVGVLTRGFPRESAVAVDVGGVRTNFRMPDILSIGLGGGSRVRAGPEVAIGPDSVGYALLTDGLVFGGKTLTATDIAVAAGRAKIGNVEAVERLDPDLVAAANQRIQSMIEEAIDRVKTSKAAVPVILVGGGAILAQTPVKGASDVLIPEHAGVANAIGAALSTVAGEVDRVFSYTAQSRQTVLEEAKAEAIANAIATGAEPETVSILDVEEIPLAYMPNGAVRVRVKAVGELTQQELVPAA